MFKAYAEAFKTNAVSMALPHTLGDNRIIKNIPVSPKDKDPKQYKHGIEYWYRCNELNVMRSTLENLLEHLGKDTRNT